MIANKLDKANTFVKENKNNLNMEFRLNYHLMGEYGWINDPNGFIYHNGEYHLFYQYHPYKPVWGPMHWGHSVSKDLIKWEYLPIALAPDSPSDEWGCFSGCSIEKDGKLFLVYTGCKDIGKNDIIQTQCIASSEDSVVFTKNNDNPILDVEQIPENSSKKDFRDPKVFKKHDKFYMILGSNDNCGNGQALLYKSENLKNWEFVNILAKSNGDLGKMWECPDMLFLENSDVFIISPQYMKAQGNEFNNVHSSIYLIGNLDVDKGIFDYKSYAALDYGFDFYAAQTIRNDEGKHILIAWMNMWESTYPTEINGHNWTGAMTIPREVVQKEDKLYFKPVDTIKNYRKNECVMNNIDVIGERKLDMAGDCYEIKIVFNAQEAEEFGLKLRANETQETVIAYSVNEKLIKLNRDKSGIGPKGERRTDINLIDNRLSLRIIVDKCSIEVFINDGEKVMTGMIFPGPDAINIAAFSIGKCSIEKIEKWDL